MVATGIEGIAFLAVRVLFGGVLAFMGLNHFLQTEEMVGYAQFKGLPAPRLSVLASGGLLVLGGLGIAVGLFALVSGIAIAGFLLVSALLMHDFWAVGEDEQEEQLTHFLKNLVMAAGALAIAVLATQNWAYSLGIGLW